LRTSKDAEYAISEAGTLEEKGNGENERGKRKQSKMERKKPQK